jgi:hypothetical protein
VRWRFLGTRGSSLGDRGAGRVVAADGGVPRGELRSADLPAFQGHQAVLHPRVAERAVHEAGRGVAANWLA